MHVLSLSGSPSVRSRSAWLLAHAQRHLADHVLGSQYLSLRELPAAALLAADTRDLAVRAAMDSVAQADVVLVGTPIYKAAYSGLLKTFLDLLPQDALRGKTVLPLATGGSPAHLLAIDYALKPVLHALGAQRLLDGVFVTDTQMPADDLLGYVPHEGVIQRLERALQPLVETPVESSLVKSLPRRAPALPLAPLAVLRC
jgi:FMN reductase